MARRAKKQAETPDTMTDKEFAAVVSAPTVDEYLAKLPPRTVGGQLNTEHYVARMARQTIAGEMATENGQETQSRLNVQKMILAEYEMAGGKASDLLDRRSPLDRVDDFIGRMVASVETMYEADPDKMLADLETAFKTAENVCLAAIGTQMDKQAQRTLKSLEEAKATAGKFLRSLLKRVRRLQQKIRDPHWTETEDEAVRQDDHPLDRYARESARPLQFMLYVARPPPDKSETGLFSIGLHHGKMAFDLWCARNGVEVLPKELRVKRIQYEGIIQVIPPGHGKTQFASCFWTLNYCERPSYRLLFLHAQAGLAQSNLKLVRSYMDPDNAEGRRTRALFPDLPKLSKYGNNASTLTFDLPGVQRTPSGKAYGITAQISGIDADGAWGDDIVDQESAQSETERQVTYDRWNGTIKARLRRGVKGAAAADTFHYTTTTLWHHEDANSRRITLVRQGKLNVLVSLQKCPGPKENFKNPLWPEVYGEAFLRKTFNEMANPRLYAACYGSNPMPDSLRIVGKLRFYDPTAAEHKDFLDRAEFHLSLDPTATAHEKSDKAGLALAAIGEAVERRTENGTETTRTRGKVRFLDMREFHTTVVLLVEEAGNYAESHNVDQVHIETRAAFHTVADLFEERFAWDPIRHDPTNRSKEMRLRNAGPFLDDSPTFDGEPVCCVEFPGVYNEEGKLVCDPQFEWAIKQILDFGFVSGDHVLDAMVQLVNWAATEGKISTGKSGTFSRRVGETAHVNQRMKDEINRIRNEGREEPDPEAIWSSGELALLTTMN